jgi:hypothetical protein
MRAKRPESRPQSFAPLTDKPEGPLPMKTTTSALTALVLLIALLLAAPGGHAQPPGSTPGVAAAATLRADQPGPVVNKNIYGHCAGRAAASPTSTTGRTASDRARSARR